jgi:chaperonin GroES
MKIKPLNDRVLILRIEEEQKTSGGISSPTTPRKNRSRERWLLRARARLMRTGRYSLDVKKGDRVLLESMQALRSD